jgi:putative oxidoreductase
MAQQNVDGGRLYWPGLAGFYASAAPWGYPIIRFIAGVIVMAHGYMKLFHGAAGPVAANVLTPLGFPVPIVWAYFLGILEFFGAALMAIGLFTRPIALMLAVEMAIVTFAWHFGNGYFFSAPRGGYEYPLLLTILYFGIFLRGGGEHSLDGAIGKEF